MNGTPVQSPPSKKSHLSVPTIRSESAWTEALQQIGHPSKQSIAGDRYALYPSSLN